MRTLVMRPGPAGADPSTRSPGDALIQVGAAVFGTGFLAVLAVMAASATAAAEVLLGVALALVPLGFCLAAVGFIVQVRGRVRRSRAGTP